MALAGAIALLLAQLVHGDAPLAAGLTSGFALLLLLLALIDLEQRLLPNLLTYPGIVVAALAAGAWPDRAIEMTFLGGGVGLGVGLFFFLVGSGAAAAGGGAGIGLGDVKLLLLIGLLVGFPAILPAIAVGVMSAIVPVAALVARGERKAVFSFGPCLAFGGLVFLFAPSPI